MIYPKIIVRSLLNEFQFWVGFKPGDKEKSKSFTPEDKAKVGTLYKQLDKKLYSFIQNNVTPLHLSLNEKGIWLVKANPWVITPLIKKLKQKHMPLYYYDNLTKSDIGWHKDTTEKVVKKSRSLTPERSITLLDQCNDLVNNGVDVLPHQLAFTDRMEAETHLGLFDDMGSGKTLAVIYWLFKQCLFPALVIAPKLLTINFMLELQKWVKPGSKKFQRIKTGKDKICGDICVIGYSILSTCPNMVKKIKETPWKACIVDEAQAVKNNSNRGLATISICKKIPNVVITTGTPVDNVPADLYNLLEILNANEKLGIRHRREYDTWFCNGRQRSWGWDNRGISNANILKAFLPFVSTRRMKADLFPNLPEKNITVSLVPLSNQTEYTFAYNDFKRWIIETITAQLIEAGEDPLHANIQAVQRAIRSLYQVHLTQLMALRQLAAIGKLTYLKNGIKTICEQQKKVVVFLYHKAVQQKLMKTFPEALHIFGEDKDTVREEALNLFSNGEKQIILSSIKTCNYGVTLVAAHHMKILEIPWTPSELTQCMDRIHRIGQTERCYIEVLLGENTVDEEIYEKLLKKEKMVDDILTVSEKDITAEIIEDIWHRR